MLHVDFGLLVGMGQEHGADDGEGKEHYSISYEVHHLNSPVQPCVERAAIIHQHVFTY